MNEAENEIKVKFVISTNLVNGVMQGADLTQGHPFTILVQQEPTIQKSESLICLLPQYKTILAY